jgi:NitT/TauT family transport system permease protein
MTPSELIEEQGRALVEGGHRRLRVLSALGGPGPMFVTSMLAIFGIWFVLTDIVRIPEYIIPPPLAVAAQFWTNRWLLLIETWVTTVEILLAFGLAIAVGIPVGLVIAFSNIADRLLTPQLVVSQAVPKIALAPILLAWFGFGIKTNVTIGFVIAVFPVVINTVLGVKSIDPAMVRLGRAMGASSWRLFIKIRVPTALPSLFAGLKIAGTFALIGAIVGEFTAGVQGLGYLIAFTTGNLNMDLAFAALVAISLLGIAVYFSVELLERIALRSHPTAQGRTAT